ncbi:MAG: CCA tRNA nucleotidyltransferase [archaeon]|nr:CCA tRNA nucleotidyltransferase [archaeon]
MKEVLQKIVPGKSEREKFGIVATGFLKILQKSLGSKAKVILGGSSAKDTWLSGNHDVDVFVQFDYKTFVSKSQHLSEELELVLKKIFPKIKIERVHGSRDYFQLIYQGYHFEVVPILKIEAAERIINITDVSPLHTEWVNSQGKNLKDEIRLAKQFCKANALYGAESYLGGFSGYVIEILVITYGSFINLLKASQKWKKKEVIDPSKFYKKDALFHLNKSKTQSPIIIVDPVDKNRNAAAALTEDKVKLFQKKAKGYLTKPSKSFFETELLTKEMVEKKAGKKPFVILTAIPFDGKEDVIGMKNFKVFEFLKDELNPFGVVEGDWEWNDKVTYYFILKTDNLPEIQVRPGPPLTMKENVKDFKKKNSKTYEQDGRIMAEIKTRNPRLKDFVEYTLKKKYVLEKVKKITVVSS